MLKEKRSPNKGSFIFGRDSMNEKTILLIQECIQEMHNFDIRWKKTDFKQLSYSKWAAEEILRDIEREKSTPPLVVIENFIRKMDEYSCMNEKASFIFSAAHDTAEHILDLLLTPHT